MSVLSANKPTYLLHSVFAARFFVRVAVGILISRRSRVRVGRRVGRLDSIEACLIRSTAFSDSYYPQVRFRQRTMLRFGRVLLSEPVAISDGNHFLLVERS
jgi:hypothetical protein